MDARSTRADLAAGYNGRRFDARPSRYPGYTSLYDPIVGKWHDFPTKDCYASMVERANKKRKKGETG